MSASIDRAGVRAVVFDIGGVLERVGEPTWADPWRERAGMSAEQFEAALAVLDPDGESVVGHSDEASFRADLVRLLRLSPVEGDAVMAAFWDWYCGELDEQMVAFARRLRGRVRTGILSNSADGARREEARRYDLPGLVDELLYSHEVGLAKPDPAVFALLCERLGVAPDECALVDDLPANIDGARAAGLRVVLHDASTTTAATIAAVESLLRA